MTKAVPSAHTFSNLQLVLTSAAGLVIATSVGDVVITGDTDELDIVYPFECEVVQRGTLKNWTLFQRGTWRVVANGKCAKGRSETPTTRNTLFLRVLLVLPGDAIHIGGLRVLPTVSLERTGLHKETVCPPQATPRRRTK